MERPRPLSEASRGTWTDAGRRLQGREESHTRSVSENGSDDERPECAQYMTDQELRHKTIAKSEGSHVQLEYRTKDTDIVMRSPGRR